MFCYHCGCRLSEHDFCTACGVDVTIYKKVIFASNMYYNDGLAKAGVRDLSGAVASLRQCLKFNKNHVEARNLLGLVYFEMGEVVAALSEWVISKNLQPEKNIADDYINRLQSNASRLESINQTIKKYNQALAYCYQDSKDLAIIQLKKVLSMNGKFLRAHQLLALLYIDSEQWEKAKRELTKCMDIDCNNTTTLRYLAEVERMLAPDENGRVVKKKSDESVRYQSDNEMIIQPAHFVEQARGGAGTLINIGVGIAIGVAAMYFLVVPAIKTNVQSDSQAKITEIGNQVDAKNATIMELEAQISDLTKDNDELHKELDAYVGNDGTLQSMEDLLMAAKLYTEGQDAMQVAEKLEAIRASVVLEDTSEAFRQLYQTLFTAVGPTVSRTNYSQGYTAYQGQDYETAIAYFVRAVTYDEQMADGWYYLAQSYRNVERKDEAVEAYQKVIALVPGTDRASRSQRYIADLTQN